MFCWLWVNFFDIIHVFFTVGWKMYKKMYFYLRVDVKNWLMRFRNHLHIRTMYITLAFSTSWRMPNETTLSSFSFVVYFKTFPYANMWTRAIIIIIKKKIKKFTEKRKTTVFALEITSCNIIYFITLLWNL